MSVVTDVIITYPLTGPTVEEVNGESFSFTEVNECGGGNKAVQGMILLAAFNYLDDASLFAHLRTRDWGSQWTRSQVQVWLKHEEEGDWTAHRLEDEA
jgi:hypothetical protein